MTVEKRWDSNRHPNRHPFHPVKKGLVTVVTVVTVISPYLLVTPPLPETISIPYLTDRQAFCTLES